MIQINLLPEELRRKARTPLRLMAAVSAMVALNGSLLAYWTWMAFGVAAEIQTSRAVAQLEMDGLTPQVTYHNSLETEKKIHASREQTLATIMGNRVLWTKELDQVIDVVNEGDNGYRHYVWFDNLQVAQLAEARGNNYGTLTASGNSGSAEFGQVANFMEDLENRAISELMLDFNPPAAPEGTQSSKDPSLIPSEVWSFPLAMTLKSPEERNKAQAAQRAKEQSK